MRDLLDPRGCGEKWGVWLHDRRGQRQRGAVQKRPSDQKVRKSRGKEVRAGMRRSGCASGGPARTKPVVGSHTVSDRGSRIRCPWAVSSTTPTPRRPANERNADAVSSLAAESH